ncbi:hypothetical protein GBA52_004620 [Prunus armeniaca]|nr:hypothetical protein GBA52_004620 [Prunus armeniaca]
MVEIVQAKATVTLFKVSELRDKRPGDKSLSSCPEFYSRISQADIPKASEAFNKGNPKVAEQGMNEADSCEHGFSGSSPLTDYNKYVHGVAAVAAAIARTLLSYNMVPKVAYLNDLPQN